MTAGACTDGSFVYSAPNSVAEDREGGETQRNWARYLQHIFYSLRRADYQGLGR